MNGKYELKISKSDIYTLIYSMFIVPFLIPDGLCYVSWLSLFFSFARLLKPIFGYIMVFLFIIKKNKLEKKFVYPLLFVFVLMLDTLVNMVDINSLLYALNYCINFLGIFLWFVNVPEDCIRKCFKAIVFVTSLVAVLNLFYLIYQPEGFTLNIEGYEKVYICGGENSMAIYLIPSLALFLSLINSEFSKLSIIVDLIISILFCLPLFLVWTGTGIGCFFLFSLLLVVVKLERLIKLKEVITIKNIVISALVLSVFVFGVEYFNPFEWFTVTFLNKSSNFSGRTVLWKQAFELVFNHPFFGLGILSNNRLYWSGTYYYSAHNIFLFFGTWGGLPGIYLFLKSIMVADQSNDKKTVKEGRPYLCLIIGLAASILYFTFECQININIFLVLLCVGAKWNLIEETDNNTIRR